MGDVDSVLADIPLGSEIRGDVDGGVGQDERPSISRHRQQEAVTEAPFGANARITLQDGVQEFVGM